MFFFCAKSRPKNAANRAPKPAKRTQTPATRTQTPANLKQRSNLELQDHRERAKYCPGRANIIITRMASKSRAVDARQQPARIATTLFHRIRQFLSNSAQTSTVCSVGQKCVTTTSSKNKCSNEGAGMVMFGGLNGILINPHVCTQVNT